MSYSDAGAKTSVPNTERDAQEPVSRQPAADERYGENLSGSTEAASAHDNAPTKADDGGFHQFQGKESKLTASEFYMYVVALCCGISLMMPVNAVFSAPAYIMNYYKYAMKDPNAEAMHTNFWNNSLTYYNLIGMSTSLIMEPLTLTRSFRHIPILPRLLTGLIILIVEIILLISVPAGGTDEKGAIITICMAGFIGGFGKSIFESTVYGMFGAFPPRYMSTMMGGIGISGALTSLIQIIVRGALGSDYDSVTKQSRIYYGLDIGIQGMTFVMLLLLRFNSFAREHFGDLGGGKSKVDAGDLDVKRLAEARRNSKNDEYVENSAAAAKQAGNGPDSRSQLDDADAELAPKAAPKAPEGSDTKTDEETEGPTSNEVLVAANIVRTLKKAFWMLITCSFNFFVTLMLFPTVVISADPDDYWFGTVAVFIFNVSDVFGRFSPSLSFMWPKTYKQRYIIVAASFARVIFLPLLILYSYHYIPSHAYGYVMMVIFGYSNGFIGSMALVLGPKSKGIIGDGERFVAGTLMGVSILVGGIIGTAISIGMQTARGV